MNAFVREKLDELVPLCVQYHVHRLEVFGSAAGETFDPDTSDVDFLVEFEDLPLGQHADAYLGLLEDLQALFGRPVDLVVSSAIRNPYFRDTVQSSRAMVYAA